MTTYAKTGFSRVFLIDGGARPDNAPEYQSCLRAGGISKGYGDISSIECPSITEYDKFTEVDTIRSGAERATTTLTGRYAADVASELLRIAELGCGADVQVHFGACTDPTDFNTFTKAVVLEAAFISDWATGELGALSSDDRNPVDETADISAGTLYEILPLTITEQAASIVTNEVVDVVICDIPACGECEDESTGCQHIYAVTLAEGGSPGTPPDIVFTVDGNTWYADDVDSLSSAEDPTGIGCVGDYIVVVSNDSGSLHYALKTEVDDVDYDETWTEDATGFVGAPNDCFRATGGRYLYVVGDSGYVYRTDDPTAGVTVLDAGVATAQNLNAVMAYSDEFVVAVGNTGAIIYTEDGLSWSAIVGPVASNLNCVWIKDELTWLIGTAAGTLYYTTDKGANWTLKGFPGSGAGVVHDIAFSTDAVGYLAHATATPAGRILRTYDGGYSWQILPEGTATIPDNDRINAVAACIYDANHVVGVGLADDAADGIIVVGVD